MEPRQPRQPPLIHNDHYAENALAFNAVALMQERLKTMGASSIGRQQERRRRSGGPLGDPTGMRAAAAAGRLNRSAGGLDTSRRRAPVAAARRPRSEQQATDHRLRAAASAAEGRGRRPRPAAGAGAAPAEGAGEGGVEDPQLSLAQRLGLVASPGRVCH
jgi:hypothetical protein